jgi:LysR family transcriptional regulator, nitrogen assimilation regulatory protein
MDVRQLRYFVKIAECGSFSRAAVELNVAQPALSQHVANVEAELGVKLLSRSTKGVALTECGETLLGHAEAILRQIENAARAVRNQAEDPSGVVSVGLPSSVSLVMAVPLLMEAERRFPNIHVKVIENHSGYLLEWVKAGHIDIAVVFDADELPSVHLRPVMTEDLYLISPAGEAGNDRKELPFRELSRYPLVLTGTAHGLRKLVERYAAITDVQLSIKTELDALSAIKDVVASGFGYSILPWPAVRRECEAGILQAQRVVDPAISRRVQLATSGDWPAMLAALRVSKLMRELMVGLVEQDHWRARLHETP